ncbi:MULTISPECIES: DUF6966 domain-containing protein [Pectobacterium]|uniref:DUF6966 domain-containing protein n=1 Tax=Pectobacterium TaxID=122277 RepID=UPI00027E0D2D|nr:MULTISPECIES: hypothetical protein [Pectobacterium]AFR03392.1 hypothetical protein PCC21_019890 [Pectobacterium carotovorum subsp. carotovorum PCC21]MBN3057393.1 hypothetical protein [Pectobacterium brasiliense]UPY93326.1 hypothetical protein MYB54_11910 [Pectobacterium sp. 21LCBS03]GKW00026.1 hypothetical protein PEC301653_30710 [Pectobacterium carotovorum subsp. carotovorum]
MTRSIEIKDILNEMARLLTDCDMNDWSGMLLRLRAYIDDDWLDAIYRILNLYGGMGSLNDLVLYKNGQMLQAENDTFDNLRTRLYALSVSR